MKRIFLIVGLVILVAITIAGYTIYLKAFAPNTPAILSNNILLIPTGSTIESIIDSLEANHQILHEKNFRWTAARMDYNENTIRRGRYKIPVLASNRAMVSLLRGGNQTPVQVTVQNVRTIEQMCGRIETKFEFDSTDLLAYFNQHFDSLAGTKKETRLTRFIPNTYEFYWTASPADFCKRMLKEYDKFWTQEKKDKAAAIGLSQDEVYTLASIIEKETNYNAEKPRMAGVYLNRLRDGIPLQADPTIVFALGEFELRRILYGHLQIDSPYNTYKNLGLPPGPIFMPGLASINAVLDREQHDYIYFCARPTEDGPGHAYAVTLDAHHVNAKRYQAWLDKQGIQ
ncbi:MAG TPA: endolytic transglycosylase MltG [Saprospiraceae bacterium]|nr:endolytic transglycosylase MltG [Saprospiraceae bacterium]